MVIKMTFRDSDLVHYLEEFCDRLNYRMFNEFDVPFPEVTEDVDENTRLINEYRKAKESILEKKKRLMNPRHTFAKGGVDQKEIIAEVLRLWKTYDEEHSIGYTPQVSIQYGVKEHWENGEVLYYFTATDQCICM